MASKICLIHSEKAAFSSLAARFRASFSPSVASQSQFVAYVRMPSKVSGLILLGPLAAVALHYAYYNFVKSNISIRWTPAMAAAVTNTFWTVRDLVEMIEA